MGQVGRRRAPGRSVIAAAWTALWLGGCQLVAGLSDLDKDAPVTSAALASATASAGATGSGGAMPCDPATSCGPNRYCAHDMGQMKGVCALCGDNPPQIPSDTCGGMCKPPASCQGKACVHVCGAGQCNMNALDLDGPEGTNRLVCTDMTSCNGLVVHCKGPRPCEIVCLGGCKGLDVQCDMLGKCTLSCQGGCAGPMPPHLACGSNLCSASCTSPLQKVNVDCGKSCACAPHPAGCG